MIYISNLQFDDNYFNYYRAENLHTLSNLPYRHVKLGRHSRSSSDDGGGLVVDGGSSSNVGGDLVVVTTPPPPRLHLWLPPCIECNRKDKHSQADPDVNQKITKSDLNVIKRSIHNMKTHSNCNSNNN